MEIRLNNCNVFRLSVAGALIAADLVEGRPRYHLHNHVRFDADLAYGKYTISSYTTGSRTTTLSHLAIGTGGEPVTVVATDNQDSVFRGNLGGGVQAVGRTILARLPKA